MRLLRGRRGPQTRVPGLKTLPGTIYREAGDRYLELFIELGGLEPDHAVLEPGCGTGRMARPLTGYLNAEGSYDGFDVVPEAVRTCVEEIGQAHPNFRFQHVDVHNSVYNRNGSLDPESFAFPYPDSTFDLVFLTSVFTHMLPPEVRHYMDEIRRVLKPTGRSLMTFFLLNPEAIAAIEAGRTRRTFEHEGEGYRYDLQGRPEAAVAYREEDACSLIESAGLRLDGEVHHGGWMGQRPAAAGQDVVIVRPSG
jgi:SAM-dependent methyltransferase